jgi:hypothetical protein
LGSEAHIVLQAINLADHDSHIALLQVASGVIDAKVVNVWPSRDVGDNHVLREDRRVQSHAGVWSAYERTCMVLECLPHDLNQGPRCEPKGLALVASIRALSREGMVLFGKILRGRRAEVYRLFPVGNEHAVNVSGPFHQLVQNLQIVRRWSSAHESFCAVETQTVGEELLQAVSGSGHFAQIVVVDLVWILNLLLLHTKPLREEILDKLEADL